jgi:hypothetical protein
MLSALATKIKTCCSGRCKIFCITHEEATEKVKTLRKQCAAVILTLTLAVSAYAGNIQCPGAVADNGTTTLTDVTTSVIVTVVTLVP